MKFQYYKANITNAKPMGWLTLDQFIKAHKHPKQNTVALFNLIADAEATGDLKTKAELKQNGLYYFTPCVHIDPLLHPVQNRGYVNIISFTGLMVLDFDHLPSEDYSKAFRQYLFEEYDSIIACWLSPSMRGVKALVKIPVATTVDEFKEYFFGMADELEQYKGWDGATQNAVLPLFQSYDPDLLYRESATTWNRRGVKINAFDSSNFTPAPDIDITNQDKETVVKIIYTGMESIYDNGHPQLRGLAIAVGGYISTGYIDKSDAVQLIRHLVEVHPYLSTAHGDRGIDRYMETVDWGINIGMSKPIILGRHGEKI